MPAGQMTVCSMDPQGRWYGADAEGRWTGNQKKLDVLNNLKF